MTRHPGRQHAIVLLQSCAISFIAGVALAAQADEGHHHAATAQAPIRTIVVRMTDTMRFEPAVVNVRRGDTVRFVARNEGRLTHELVVGTASELQAHAAVMKNRSGHSHGGGHGVSVPPGQTGDFVATFAHAETLEMACLEPGHYEAGMRGRIDVTPHAAHGAKP